MPIPTGASQVPGEPNRVRLSSGEVVTRARALNEGAQERGYRNHREYTRDQKERGNPDRAYTDAWLRSRQGQEAIRKEKELARAEGRRYSRTRLEQRLIAARNARPHPASGKPAGGAFLAFIERYSLALDELVRY